MFLCDYHIHTRYSFDADAGATLDAICKSAIDSSLSAIAITDHLDVNYKYEYPEIIYDYKSAKEEIFAAKDKYKGKLDISYGIELGQAHHYPEDTKKILEQNCFEFVIGSLHNLRSMKDFYFYFRENNDLSIARLNELYSKCLDEICEYIMLFGDRIDTVGHITYMHRYMAECGIFMDFAPHKEKLCHLFSLAISKNVAIELNTSTLYKGLGFTMPSIELMKMYYDMGGELVTIGSDAHTDKNVGRGVKEGIELLKSVGFDSLLCVQNSKKQLMKI